MNVTVDLDNQCPEQWAPDQQVVADWLATAWQALAEDSKINVSVQVLGEAATATLNQQFRGKPGPTNVLSFPSHLPAFMTEFLEAKPLGDIVACATVIAREAAQQGKSTEAHWAHMLTHGFLHLNGYDHQTEDTAAAMESLEIAILERLGFTNPY
ncbi:MAG: hypothetical protein RLZZ385_315 [Pseudomonadota bacterium]|jgi:probable rRNA maturation factor